MAVISIRLNEEEAKIVTFLSDQLDKDKSSLIKYALKELYEDFIDNKKIDEYEAQENDSKQHFIQAEDILKSI